MRGWVEAFAARLVADLVEVELQTVGEGVRRPSGPRSIAQTLAQLTHDLGADAVLLHDLAGSVRRSLFLLTIRQARRPAVAVGYVCRSATLGARWKDAREHFEREL